MNTKTNNPTQKKGGKVSAGLKLSVRSFSVAFIDVITGIIIC